MLLSHHWLCLVFLTILISPSYAAPTPPLLPAQTANIAVPYTVKVVNKENGGMIETVTGAVASRVLLLIKELDHFRNGQVKLTNVVRSSQTENPSKMAMDYFEVLGGPFCLISGDCYGYVVTTKTRYVGQDMRIGAVVIHHRNPESFTVDDYMPSRYVNQDIAVENHRKKYLEFLGTFTPVDKWAEAMLPAAGPAAPTRMSENSRLREVRELLFQGRLHRFVKAGVPPSLSHPNVANGGTVLPLHGQVQAMARPLHSGPPSSSGRRLSAGHRLLDPSDPRRFHRPSHKPPVPHLRHPVSRPTQRLPSLQELGLSTRPTLPSIRELGLGAEPHTDTQ